MASVHANAPPRVKFTLHRLADVEGDAFLDRHANTAWSAAALALAKMEDDGAAPVGPDGRGVGGNVALVIRPTSSASYTCNTPTATPAATSLLVSRSGKEPHHTLTLKDFVEVVSFDVPSWSCTYRSFSADMQPTSDTPLYWHALMIAPTLLSLGESEKPLAALHGHLLPDEETAARLKVPVSEKQCMFSTPEDAECMLSLLKQCPYPADRLFVRKGHGELAFPVVLLFRVCACVSMQS